MANKSICDTCLQAIDKMSLEEGCRWRLGQANACELTARCLYKHMQVRDTVKHALSTLNGLTFRAFHNQTRFLEKKKISTPSVYNYLLCSN